MNRDYMANMLFNINDVVETVQSHLINDDIIEDYHEDQFNEEPTHINELHSYFNKMEKK